MLDTTSASSLTSLELKTGVLSGPNTLHPRIFQVTYMYASASWIAYRRSYAKIQDG